jgi:hypothetical protein
MYGLPVSGRHFLNNRISCVHHGKPGAKIRVKRPLRGRQFGDDMIFESWTFADLVFGSSRQLSLHLLAVNDRNVLPAGWEPDSIVFNFNSSQSKRLLCLSFDCHYLQPSLGLGYGDAGTG